MPGEDRYRRATLAGRAGVWDWNLATDEIFVDPILKEILGYEDHEIPNHMDHWGSLVHPADAAAVRERADAHIAGKTRLFQLEHRMLHRDGSVRWFLATGSVTRDAEGRAVSMAGTDIDITERKQHEDALRRAEALNRQIVESSRDCIKILNLEGDLLHINQAGLRLLEADDESLVLGRRIADLYDRKLHATIESALAAARQGGIGRFQGHSRSLSGMIRSWDVVVTPIDSSEGEVSQLLAISRDITERHREELFRATEHRMLEKIAGGSELTEVLESLVLLVEQYCDGTLCSVLLLDEDGKTIRHGAAPNLDEDFVRAVDGLSIGPRAGSCGTSMYTRETVIVEDILSDPLWADFRETAGLLDSRACWSTPIFSADETVIGSIAMYAPEPRAPRADELELMTSAAHFAWIAIEKQRAQQALRQSEARNRAILRAIPDWMFLISADCVFLDFHARDISGFYASPSAFLGKRIEEVMPASLSDILVPAIGRVIESDKPEKLEYSLFKKDEERFYEASLVRCDGDMVVSIVRDVTQRKLAEVETASQRSELAHLGRVAVLGELTGTLAHELSQPLTAMRTNAAVARLILDTEPVPLDELRDALDDIVVDNRRASDVIGRLRALLRKEEPEFVPIDLNELVHDVIELAHGEILSRRIVVEQALAPAAAVLGDRIQLQQVILNLVLNACDAMGNIPIADRRLSVRTRADKTCVELAVSDRGAGLPDGEHEKVFEPFVTFREEGLGLGLAISRSIVSAHDGSISAENNPDGGALFRCQFPVTRAEAVRQTG